MINKKIILAMTCSAMLNGMIAASVFATDQNSSTGIQVKEFRYLDKEFDRISLDSISTPDGIRDGHLTALLDAGEGTEILSITMKTADADGRDTSHGMWKTWKEKADIGTLLAVFHDGKSVNTTFQKTLGTFKGKVQFDLYASDNNGMKPGEYYYLEILTSKGTVKSNITPFSENEVSYAPVAIREFSWLDLDSDRTGVAEFGADHVKEGHFKLKLNFAQKTDISAVILRGTDKDGGSAPGIWRTNRAGTGWLLGMTQGEMVVTPGFKKDVKEPVGSFRGSVVFDLYANNNGSIKNGEYYLVEVETPYGTVKSQPVKFGDPASNYVNHAPLGFKSIFLKLNSNAATVDEQEHTLEVAPFTLDGRTMVPIRFIGEALGAKVEWQAQERRVILQKEGSKVELIIDRKDAFVDGAPTELDSPAVIRDGITLVPVRFVSESLKMKVFFEDGEITITDAKEIKSK